jgi:predicted metal-binding membrane protein
MGTGLGTMGLSLGAFLVVWAVMMAAMMFPSVAPMAAAWLRTISARPTRAARGLGIAEFLGGYLVAWAGFGALVYVLLLGADRLSAASPTVARWTGVLVFAVAGIYQLTPLKSVCLRHCRSPLGAVVHYAGYHGPVRDLRVGIHHGLYCVGCCWGLMILLVALGAMNVAAMVALAGVIFIEKIWRHGAGFATAIGVALLAAAVFTVFSTALVPGLNGEMAPMGTGASPSAPAVSPTAASSMNGM